MYDQSLFLRTLSEFSARLLSPYDVDIAVHDLMDGLTDVLKLDGSGVGLARDGRLEFTMAIPERLAELETVQLEHQSGPCIEAYQSGQVVAITDLSTTRDRWPEYCVVAERLGLASVAGIPMRLSANTIGAVNLYGAGARAWPEDDIIAATVMADLATNYLINAARLREEEQLNQQLHSALDSKSVIEQAKGIVANLHDTTVEHAFDRIRTHARNHNVTVRAVAEGIVRLGMRI